MISEGLLKNLGNTSVLPMVTPLLRVFVTVRGRSQTTFTRFDFFQPPTPLRLHSIWYKSLQKVDFLTTYPLLV